MDGIARLGSAVALVERLLAQETRVPPGLECRTVAYMRARPREEGTCPVVFVCNTVGRGGFPVEWGVATVDAQERGGLLSQEKEGIRTIDLKAVGACLQEAVGGPECTMEERSFVKTIDAAIRTADHTQGGCRCSARCRAATVLFEMEAQKKLKALERVVGGTKKMLEDKESLNRGMFTEFKNLIRKNTESTVSEPHSRSPAAPKGEVSDSRALARLVESPSFEKCLDRQIVATIFRGEGFRRHLSCVLEAEDVAEIVETHVPWVVDCLAGLVRKSGGGPEYERLAGVMNGGCRRDGGGAEDGRRQLEDYRSVFGEIMERVSKGNFECDRRFLRIISRTIDRIGVYDDPVLCKMTVQFVLCKKYVEDFIEIKRALKRFARCDI